MTKEEYENNLDLAAKELDKTTVDIFKKYRLSPASAGYLMAEIAAKIAKYSVEQEYKHLELTEKG